MKHGITRMDFARSIKALRRAERHYLNQGYDPVEAMHLVYDRAVGYYDNVFPEDEVGFRDTLLRRREKSLKLAFELRRRESKNNSEE